MTGPWFERRGQLADRTNSPDTPVRLYLGDPVLVDDAARAFIADRAPGAELLVIRPPFDSLASVRASVSQMGLFAESRAVWIRGLRNEPADEVDDLLDLLAEGLPADSLLVATADSLDQRSRLFKHFKSSKTVVDCRLGKDKAGRLFESAAAEFVGARLRANGVTSPTLKVVSAIVRRAGSEVGELAQEIDKLCLAADDGTPDAQLVDATMRDLGEVWVFALTDALSERDLGAAQSLFERLMRQGEPALRLLAVLGSHFGALSEAHRELDRLGPGALSGREIDAAQYKRLSPDFRARHRSSYRAFFLLKGASAYRADELHALHRRLVHIDVALKSSQSSHPDDLLSGFLVQACAAAA